MKDNITFCCSTYNTLNYLKLAIKSVRQNAHFKDAPFVVHDENCDDGTNEWLHRNVDKYNLEVYVEPHTDPVRGIGGGMNFCAEKVKTEYILFIQSDFYCARHFDIELLKVFDDYDKVIEYATYDERLDKSHWAVPGPDGKLGFGGSCFPKDINALIKVAEKMDITPNVISAAWDTNLNVRPEQDWKELKGRAVVDDQI